MVFNFFDVTFEKHVSRTIFQRHQQKDVPCTCNIQNHKICQNGNSLQFLNVLGSIAKQNKALQTNRV